MSDEMAQYRAYLRHHFWVRVAPVLVGSGLVVGFCQADFWQFIATGHSLLSPLLDLFFTLGGSGLAFVALVATWTILLYTSLWGDR